MVTPCVAYVSWCYHLPSCSKYPIFPLSYCNGTRQSPINIVSASATLNANLTEFTFVNYDNKSAMKAIENTGETVRFGLTSQTKKPINYLSGIFCNLQFHLHWGNGSSVPGSEHTVDGLHIVNSKSSYNGNTTQAVKDSTGLAALGFFIEVREAANEKPESWYNLTSYLANITTKAGFSLNDLLVGVDRSKYYRYLGSLTTPSCNEAVVWTVFKEPIKVSRDLIDLFSTTVRVNDSTSEHITDIYRYLQPAQPVSTQNNSVTTNSASTACFSLVFPHLSKTHLYCVLM
uniref:Alpha-carbonic anhydrase domain-containing protein n=1 Tax=Amphilophus citrinellus TaxID=61819 RepID=A0A3Q0SH75_AMPCI